jgi:hypothetical protein
LNPKLGLAHPINETIFPMKKIYIPLLAVVALFVSGCYWPGIRGNGHVVTDQRTVTDFSDIKADGAFRIEWHSGPPSLSVTTDDNLLRYINQTIEGKTLHLRSHDQLSPTQHIQVLITSPTFTGASMSGAVRLTATQISCPKFYLQTAGAARVTLDGTADALLADMSGAARLNAENLHTKTADITSSGAARAEVYATEALRVSISGAGKVIYYGHPPKVEKHVSGAGSINPGD